MVLGPALADDRVLGRGGGAWPTRPPRRRTSPGPRRGPSRRTTLVVVGHHLAGQPRNGDIVDRGGYLLDRTTTSADYRLVVVGAETPLPALVRVPSRAPPSRSSPGPSRPTASPTSSRTRPRPSASARSPWPTAASSSASSRARPSRPTPTRPTSPAMAAGAATWPPWPPGTDRRPPLRIPAPDPALSTPGARDVLDPRDRRTRRDRRRRPAFPVPPDGRAHRSGGDRHAARLPPARRVRRDPRQRRLAAAEGRRTAGRRSSRPPARWA